MKYTIYYGKMNKNGVGDADAEFDTFNCLEDAKEVLDNIESYLSEGDKSGWCNVQKGDYLAFVLFAIGETEEEREELCDADSLIDWNSYTGIIYGSTGMTNK